MKRLPVVLSVAAFVIALLSLTPLGEAAKNALPYARNADAVDGLHASTTPRNGRLLPLDKSGKFPARVLTRGLKGDPGTPGPPGPPGSIQQIDQVVLRFRIPAGHPPTEFTALCPINEGIISGGGSTGSGTIFIDKSYDGQSWTIGVDNWDQPVSAEGDVIANCAPGVVVNLGGPPSNPAEDVALRRAADRG